MKYKMIRQKPVRGGRIQMGAGVEKMISDWVERQSARFGVSRPFVISTALAQVAGIELDEDYRKVKQTRKLELVKQKVS